MARQMFELGHEACDIGHAHAVGHVFEHLLVVGRVADIHPARQRGVQIDVEQLACDPARTFELVVLAEPAVDVDGADGGIHARGLHDGHAFIDLCLRHMSEFAVIHGDIAFATGRIGGTSGAGHGGFDLLEHLLHAGKVAGTLIGRLLVELVQAALGIAAQRHGTVLGHDGVHGPGRCKRHAPADGAAGDGHHFQTRILEARNGGHHMLGHHAVGGQRVVDIGQHAQQLGRCLQFRQRTQKFLAHRKLSMHCKGRLSLARPIGVTPSKGRPLRSGRRPPPARSAREGEAAEPLRG